MIDLPRFRYIDDILRFVTNMGSDLAQQQQVLDQQQQLLTTHLKPLAVKGRSKLADLELRTGLPAAAARQIVPLVSKLSKQYSLAQELNTRYKTLEALETALSLNFDDRSSTQHQRLASMIEQTQSRLRTLLFQCLTWLADVADANAPKKFSSYCTKVFADVLSHTVCGGSRQFGYLDVVDGNLVFTNYLVLQHLVNDEGQTAEHLYASIQWTASTEPVLVVDLCHEFELPQALAVGSGTSCRSSARAVLELRKMLVREGFDHNLGVLPTAHALNVDPTTVDPVVDYSGSIADVEIGQALTFVLKPGLDAAATAAISTQLYRDLKPLVRNNGVSIKMSRRGRRISFVIERHSSQPLQLADLDFMRQRMGLTSAQLRLLLNSLPPPQKELQ